MGCFLSWPSLAPRSMLTGQHCQTGFSRSHDARASEVDLRGHPRMSTVLLRDLFVLSSPVCRARPTSSAPIGKDILWARASLMCRAVGVRRGVREEEQAYHESCFSEVSAAALRRSCHRQGARRCPVPFPNSNAASCASQRRVGKSAGTSELVCSGVPARARASRAAVATHMPALRSFRPFAGPPCRTAPR